MNNKQFPKDDNYYFDKEKEWREKLPRHTDKQLLEIFPEAKEIVPRKIREWNSRLKRDKRQLKTHLRKIYTQNLDEFSTWFWEKVARLYLMPSILEADKQVLRLKRLQSLFSPDRSKQERWQEKVEKARQYPIYEIAKYKLLLNPSGDRLSSLCPFHDEKHASFYIYTRTNTFHCFGCGESGDILKLTQHLYGVDFKEAVRMLSN